MENKPQLILVADDEKLLELANGSKIKFDNKLMLDIAISFNNFFWGPLAYPFNKLLQKGIGNKKEMKVFSSMKEGILKKIQNELSLSTDIHCLSPLEAKDIKLDIGDRPTNGSFYIKHPLLEDVYIRPCDYEITLAREKEVAFRRISSSLGAKKITLRDAKFFDKKGNISVDTSLLNSVCSNLGISAQFNQSGEIVKEVYSEFGIPRKEPYIPDELKDWVRLDPDLRTMASDRLEGHLLRHHVTIKFKEELTGGGRIAAEIANNGLDIGGSLSKNISSVWIFEVEYYPL